MLNKQKQFTSLPRYWEGVAAIIDARLKASKEYLRHPITGISAECYFRDVLKEYLPSRYAVDTGFVINADGQRSDNLDVIVADTLHIPPLCSEPNYKVFAVESVCAVMEITTSPRAKEKGVSKFEIDIAKLAKVREMGKTRSYVEIQPIKTEKGIEFLPQEFSLKGSPRCFLITAGDEWKKKDTYEQNLIKSLRNAKKTGFNAWINAALSLQHGMLSFRPYKEYEAKWIIKNSLLNFLMFVNECVSTFVTFKINIRKYVKGIPNAKSTEGG